MSRSSTSSSCRSSFSLPLILLLGLGVRLALFAALPEAALDALARRVELASPATAEPALREAAYLARAHRVTLSQAQGAQDAAQRGEAKRESQLPQIVSPSPWESGHVHASPLLLAALEPLLDTPALELHLKPRARRAPPSAAKGRRRESAASASSAASDGASSGSALSALSSTAARSGLTGLRVLLALLDVLAAACLARAERARAAWRTRHARIAGARDAELRAAAVAEERARAAQGEKGAGAGAGASLSASAGPQPPPRADRAPLVAALYLFNPLTLLTCLASSAGALHNALALLAVAAAVLLAEQGVGAAHRRGTGSSGSGGGGQMRALAYALVFAAALAANALAALHPLLLAPALLMLASSGGSARTTASAHPRRPLFARALPLASLTLALLLGGLWASLGPLSAYHPHAVLRQVYAHVLLVPDLTPNIGLWWYFFMEMFDHFRAFFLLAFNVHLAAYALPFLIKYNADPLFAVTATAGTLAVFKSYPTLADTALYFGLLSLHPEIYPYLRYPTLTAMLYVYSLCLLPLFHHLWLHAGSGNANFFYAITLVFALAGGSSVLDALWAWGALAWEKKRPLRPLADDEAHLADAKRVIAQS